MSSWNAFNDEEFNEASADFGVYLEDRKAQEIIDQSVTLVNGHYQLKASIPSRNP